MVMFDKNQADPLTVKLDKVMQWLAGACFDMSQLSSQFHEQSFMKWKKRKKGCHCSSSLRGKHATRADSRLIGFIWTTGED